MSRWTHLSGRIIIHKTSKCSLKGVAELIFDDSHSFGMEQEFDGDCYIYEVNINFCDEGECAWKQVYKFKNHLVTRFGARCSLKAEICL